MLTNIKTNFKFVLTLTSSNQRHRFVYRIPIECISWKTWHQGSRKCQSSNAVYVRVFRLVFFIHGHSLLPCQASHGDVQTRVRSSCDLSGESGDPGWTCSATELGLHLSLCNVKGMTWTVFSTPVQLEQPEAQNVSFIIPFQELGRHASKHCLFVEKCFFSCVDEIPTECKSGHLKYSLKDSPPETTASGIDLVLIKLHKSTDSR